MVSFTLWPRCFVHGLYQKMCLNLPRNSQSYSSIPRNLRASISTRKLAADTDVVLCLIQNNASMYSLVSLGIVLPF